MLQEDFFFNQECAFQINFNFLRENLQLDPLGLFAGTILDMRKVIREADHFKVNSEVKIAYLKDIFPKLPKNLKRPPKWARMET